MIDPLAVWKSSLAALPKTANNSWAPNFATWYADRISGIEPLFIALDASAGFTFTFAKQVFETALLNLGPAASAVAGLTAFANAWQSAMLASTVVVLPGAFIPPSTPPTTFSSIIPPVVLDAPGIVAGKAKIIELASAPVVSDPNDSQFPVKFREATLELTITVTGLNSAAPTPQPLIAAGVPLT